MRSEALDELLLVRAKGSSPEQVDSVEGFAFQFLQLFGQFQKLLVVILAISVAGGDVQSACGQFVHPMQDFPHLGKNTVLCLRVGNEVLQILQIRQIPLMFGPDLGNLTVSPAVLSRIHDAFS